MAALDWTQKDPTTRPAKVEPDGNDNHQRLLALKERRDIDAAAVRRLETDVIPSLERELADLEKQNAAKETPKVHLATETSGLLKVSQMLPVIVDFEGTVDHTHVPSGTIITTGSETEAESLKRQNPNRHVVRVSLETLRERKVAGHVG